MDIGEKLFFDHDEAPILHRVFPGVRAPSLEKRKMFEEEYQIVIRSGKFSEKEDKRIIRNYNKFIKTCDLVDDVVTRCALLGFALENPDAQETISLIKQLVQPCGLYFRLAYKLPNRTISSIYSRTRKLFCPFRRIGEVDSKTKEEMLEYAKRVYGQLKHLWAHMANKFNCDPQGIRANVTSKFDFKKMMPYNSGKFSINENIRLLDSICRFLELDPKDLSAQIIKQRKMFWPVIAQGVKTRDSVSCWSHAISKTLLGNLSAWKRSLIKWRANQARKEQARQKANCTDST
ncbi:uncharacterized protein LOC128389454 [Panonychus citri]|uniref:uncharacterized protein LOC128389454 n=1 Tax=Panonychus citri TaxID=50023 RepID=UPI0023072D88|nr:uncharacterized protein LOC128389454 [Panonychus citri]